MRYLAAIVLTALSLSVLPSQAVLADGLNSEQLKKLLSGNTLYFKGFTATTRRPLERWQYFQADGTWKIKIEIEGRRQYIEREYENTWKVTGNGTYCISKNPSGKRSCSSNVRVKGDTVTLDRTLDGKSDGEREYKLQKGNPKSL